MTIRILKDEEAVRDLVVRGQRSRLREKPVHVSISGLSLPDAEKKHLESQIQQMIATELEQALLRKREKRAIRVSLSAISLPDQGAKRIESKVEQVVKEMLPRLSPEQHPPEQEIIVDVCGGPPGQNEPPDPADWDKILTAMSSFPPPWLIAWCFSEDIVISEVNNVSVVSPYNLPPDEMDILLNTKTGWAKQIVAWAYCRGNVRQILAAGLDWSALLRINRAFVDTILFTKPKFLGIWTDMYHLDPARFWDVFGGKFLKFTWYCDNCYCGE